MTGEPSVEQLLARLGFDPEESSLTPRQAQVLVLREQELTQEEIADRWGTSRANVANVEASARANLEKAQETVAFVDQLLAPLAVRIDRGTDLYDVPDRVFQFCDDCDVKADVSAMDLIDRVANEAGRAVRNGSLSRTVVVEVGSDGSIQAVRVPPLDEG
jgi:hypothetical protein